MHLKSFNFELDWLFFKSNWFWINYQSTSAGWMHHFPQTKGERKVCKRGTIVLSQHVVVGGLAVSSRPPRKYPPHYGRGSHPLMRGFIFGRERITCFADYWNKIRQIKIMARALMNVDVMWVPTQTPTPTLKS